MTPEIFTNPYDYNEWSEYSQQQVEIFLRMFDSEAWKLLEREFEQWTAVNYKKLRTCEMHDVQYHRGVLESLENIHTFITQMRAHKQEQREQLAFEDEQEIMGDD